MQLFEYMWPFGPLWVLGVVICIAGTSMTALGLVFQKKSHTENEKSGNATMYYGQPWWIFGFSVFLVGQIFNVVAMSMAPQAMLSCLGAWSLIFNAIFAWAVLGESIHTIDLVTMVGMLVGAIVVVCTTPVGEGLVNGMTGVDEIVGPLFNAEFLWLSAGIASLLLLLQLSICRSAVPTPLFLTLCSAVLSGYIVTLFRCISFLVLDWRDTRPWVYWECYIVLLIAGVLCVAQIHMLNLALHSGRAVAVVPNYFAFSLLAQIGICEAVYQEMRDLRGFQAVFFVSGIVLILVCVIAIVRVKITMEEEVFESKHLEMEKSPSLSTPLLVSNSKTLPARIFSVGDFMTFSSSEDTSEYRRSFSSSSMDPQVFHESFGGRQRSYTLSVTGPLGLG